MEKNFIGHVGSFYRKVGLEEFYSKDEFLEFIKSKIVAVSKSTKPSTSVCVSMVADKHTNVKDTIYWTKFSNGIKKQNCTYIAVENCVTRYWNKYLALIIILLATYPELCYCTGQFNKYCLFTKLHFYALRISFAF